MSVEFNELANSGYEAYSSIGITEPPVGVNDEFSCGGEIDINGVSLPPQAGYAGTVLHTDGQTTYWSFVTHSALIGLEADDHPQYFNQIRGDARYFLKIDSTRGDLLVGNDSNTWDNLNISTNTSAILRTDGVDLYWGDFLFSDLGDLPTTLAGYGITDAYTKLELSTGGSSIVHWDNLIGVPSYDIPDHGVLSGLTDDDHPQYLTETRGNLLYYTQLQLGNSGGAAVHWNNITNIPPIGITSHSSLSDLTNDDHPQYLTEARGDARYYTFSNLQTSGQSEVHWLNITDTPYNLLGYGITDAYTQTQLGTSGQSSVHWDNLTNIPSLGGLIEHDTLLGLSDDDHPQYALLSGRDGDILNIDTINSFNAINGVDVEDINFKDGDITLTAGKRLYFDIEHTTYFEHVLSFLPLHFYVNSTLISTYGHQDAQFFVPIKTYETNFGIINEFNTNQGVTIEGVLVQDGYIDWSYISNAPPYAFGAVLADSTDPLIGYLNAKVDGTSILVDTTEHQLYGRHHIVDDITARNNIASTQRSISDIVEVINTVRGVPETYQLVGGITDNDWYRVHRIISYANYDSAIEVEKTVLDIPVNTTTTTGVGDFRYNKGLTIDYVLVRGTRYIKGIIEILLKSTTTIPIIHNEFFGDDIGVTFDASYSGNEILLDIIVDNLNTDTADLYYNITRVMGVTPTGNSLMYMDIDTSSIMSANLVANGTMLLDINTSSTMDVTISAYANVAVDMLGESSNYFNLSASGTIQLHAITSSTMAAIISSRGSLFENITTSSTMVVDISSKGFVQLPITTSTVLTMSLLGVGYIEAAINTSSVMAANLTDAGVIENLSFYVSSSGNDTDDGTTPATAWQTIEKVNTELGTTITASDIIGFRRGDIFNDGTLDFTGVSGTVGNPITMSTYGTGDNPKFSGLHTLGTSWSDLGSNIWSYDLTSLNPGDVRYLLSNGVKMNMAKSDVRFADSSVDGSFTDDDLGGANDDYNNAEVIMRTSNYTWEARIVNDYSVSGSAGTVTLNYLTSYHLTELTTGNGGYFFQNSRHILEQNTVQGEWVIEGNTLYMYSTTKPSDLTGDIQVSLIDIMIDLDASSYISIENIDIEYINQYGIYGVGADYKSITNSNFSNVIWGIWDISTQVDPVVVNNTFNDIFNVLYLGNATNPLVTDNSLTDIGMVIGKNRYISTGSQYWGYDGLRFAHVNGGLIQNNNIENIGYCGIKTTYTDGGVEFKENYVKNSNLLLIDGGAFYTWEKDNVTKTGGTFSDNIAVYDAYDDVRYAIGRQDGEVGFGATGFYKDGYERNIKWYNNFSYGYESTYHANAGTNCEWIGNIGAAPKPKEGEFVSPFRLQHYSSYSATDFIIKNNIIVAFHYDTMPYWQRIIRASLEEVQLSEGGEIDYNRWIQPSGIWYSSNHAVGYLTGESYPDNDKDIQHWRDEIPIHGGHDQSNIMTMDLSGLTDPEEFMWYSTNPTKTNGVSVSFPSGYRYYNIDGVRILTDTLDAYKGQIYFRTIDEPLPLFTTVEIVEGSGSSTTIFLDTDSTITNSEDTYDYQWCICQDNQLSSRDPISGADSSTYIPLETDGFTGTEYLTVGVTRNVLTGGNTTLLKGVQQFSQLVLIEIIDYYVSNNGDDNANGTTAGTAWETLDKLSQEFNSNNIPAGSIIGLEGGSVFNEDPIDTYARSGSSGSEIIITRYSTGDNPIIKGTRELSGTWTEETGLGSNIWSFTDATIAVDVRNLYIDGTRQEMGKTTPSYFTKKETDAQSRFYDDNLGGTNDDWNGSEIVLRSSQWTEDTLTVSDYYAVSDEPNYGNFNTATNASYAMRSSATTTHKYLLQNHWRTLLAANSPSQGEWAYDSTTDKIYIYSTSNPSTLGTIEISIEETLVDVSDSNYIKFNNVDFQKNNSRSILAIDSSYIEVDSCNFNDGVRGIDFWGDTTNQTGNIVTNSSFTNLISSGVYYFNQNSVYIVDNDLTMIGTIIGSRVGTSASVPYSLNWAHNAIEIQNGGINADAITVQYNKIDGAGYCGIKITGSEDAGFIVDKNYVKDALYTLSDGGAIYFVSNFDSVGYTREVTNNLLEFSFNDSLYLYTGSYKAHGIYKDRSNYNIISEDNTIMGYLVGANYSYAGIHNCEYRRNTIWVGQTAVNDALHTRPTAFDSGIYIYDESWGGFPENNLTEDNIFITTYNSTLQDSITSTFKSEDAHATQDYRLLGNYFNGNVHIALSGQQYDSRSKETIWLKGYGYDPTDWPNDILTVDDYRTYMNTNDLNVGDEELGWELLNFLDTGLTAGTEHDQVYWDFNVTKESRALILPAGYYYYDLDGVRVTSGTVDAWGSTVLIKTIEEPLPNFTTVEIVEGSGSSTTIILDTDDTITNTEASYSYQWYICYTDNKKSRRAIVDATSSTYTPIEADGFTGTEYLLVGVVRKVNDDGNTSLLTGIEQFSQLILIEVADNLVTNGGGTGTTDWIDTDDNGVADDWQVIGGALHTASIVTGNGFVGNAQRLVHDDTSGYSAMSFGISDLVVDTWYDFSIKARGNTNTRIYMDGTTKIAEVIATSGNPNSDSGSFQATSTFHSVRCYFTPTTPSQYDWMEIDEVNFIEQ